MDEKKETIYRLKITARITSEPAGSTYSAVPVATTELDGHTKQILDLPKVAEVLLRQSLAQIGVATATEIEMKPPALGEGDDDDMSEYRYHMKSARAFLKSGDRHGALLAVEDAEAVTKRMHEEIEKAESPSIVREPADDDIPY